MYITIHPDKSARQLMSDFIVGVRGIPNKLCRIMTWLMFYDVVEHRWYGFVAVKDSVEDSVQWKSSQRLRQFFISTLKAFGAICFIVYTNMTSDVRIGLKRVLHSVNQWYKCVHMNTFVSVSYRDINAVATEYDDLPYRYMPGKNSQVMHTYIPYTAHLRWNY